MTRRPLLAGNWKMYKTVAEARTFAESLGAHVQRLSAEMDFVVCAPFTALHVLKVTLPTRVALGAQNVYHEPQGAFTGEIAPEMLVEHGVSYVIVGHSERRGLFQENDTLVRLKTEAVLGAGMIPILCVGEDVRQRELGHTASVVERQTRAAIAELSEQATRKVVVAYEPIWAIGSGHTASPQDAEDVIFGIRAAVRAEKGDAAADAVRILYGGSVKPENIAEFASKPNIDGALVGGASLKPDSFLAMAEAMASATGGAAR